MASQDKGRPLPKFGEWDVNNPASAEGFTVIFSKARDEKKSNGVVSSSGATTTTQKNDNSAKPSENCDYPPMKKWFCCF
ncbi:RPM1-interacting protein 4 isoform X1 [Morus notabilis]|uniref:RPM1-interacting protein 4 isoform X1 n=1 Tax=Morus notabilis TaxID=981085 RepID=UPI000CED33DA|nr:RPM1-interacting protein 4 isoform X1 [Morus notabilis]